MSNHNVNKDNICIIAGMPRAATTFLYHTLPKHPSVFVPSRKETEYFSLNYYRGEDWYLDFFSDMAAEHIGFDISPMYFMDKRSPERILGFNPKAKVILMVRNPVDWIFSFYKNRQSATYKKLDFKNFLDGHLYIKDGKELKLDFRDNVTKNNITNYSNIFGNSLLLCDFALFDQNPLPVLKAIEKFVGIPHFFTQFNFENVKILASSNQNLRIVNYLMHKKFFADLIVKLFPKGIIMFVRRKLQTSSSETANIKMGIVSDDENVKLAQEVFAEDVKFVDNLFRNSKLLLGNGKPFDYS